MIFYLLYDIFSISAMRECHRDEVRKQIMIHMTNEPQLSVELLKTTHPNLRPHKCKPEKVHGWADPETWCSCVLIEFTGCCVEKRTVSEHTEGGDPGLITDPLLTTSFLLYKTGPMVIQHIFTEYLKWTSNYTTTLSSKPSRQKSPPSQECRWNKEMELIVSESGKLIQTEEK